MTRLHVLLLLMAGASVHAGEFDSAGVKLHYLDEGAGEAVVLLHGLHGSAATNWKLPGTLGQLARRYRTIALDCRGHGRSARPAGRDDYGPKLVADVLRLFDHLKLERAHVVGYSMGGIIALRFAAQHPDRVRSVVLGGMGWLQAGSLAARAFGRMGQGALLRTPAACAQSLGALALTRDELLAIKPPVTMIVGTRDPVRRLYVAPAHAARHDWPVHTIEGAGHVNCIARPEFQREVAAALLRHAAKR